MTDHKSQRRVELSSISWCLIGGHSDSWKCAVKGHTTCLKRMFIYPLSSKARGWLVSVLKSHVRKCASISGKERENWILSWSKIKPTSLHQWPFPHTKIPAIHSLHHLSAFSSWVSFPSCQLFCTSYFISFAFYNHSISLLVARILPSFYRCLWRTPSIERSFMSLTLLLSFYGQCWSARLVSSDLNMSEQGNFC